MPHIVQSERPARPDCAGTIVGDATQFWHVADANTALDSRTLVETPGDTLNVPRS